MGRKGNEGALRRGYIFAPGSGFTWEIAGPEAVIKIFV